MKFLANENIPYQSVKILRDAGFDIVSVSEEFPSVKDETVILYSTIENRIILTFDRDYGDLIFNHGINFSVGVVYLRISSFEPAEPARILLKLFKANLELEGYFTVISENNIRQRKL